MLDAVGDGERAKATLHKRDRAGDGPPRREPRPLAELHDHRIKATYVLQTVELEHVLELQLAVPRPQHRGDVVDRQIARFGQPLNAAVDRTEVRHAKRETPTGRHELQ